MTTAKLEQQPNIRLYTWKIAHMALVSTNRLLLTVPAQSKVMLVQSKTGQVLSEIVLQNQPGFICMVSANRAATTIFNKTIIQFIQVNERTLETDSTTNVDVNAYGIAPYRNNLVVSYLEPSGVKIISNDGETIHKLDNATAGREVFKSPEWIATTSDGSIYVTDWGTREITRLDSSLAILQTFSGAILRTPQGILALNNDQLLVCSWSNSSVVLIRPSTNSMTVLLDKQQGIKRPVSLCFCKEQKKMYVALAYVDTILVYKLS